MRRYASIFTECADLVSLSLRETSPQIALSLNFISEHVRKPEAATG